MWTRRTIWMWLVMVVVAMPACNGRSTAHHAARDAGEDASTGMGGGDARGDRDGSILPGGDAKDVLEPPDAELQLDALHDANNTHEDAQTDVTGGSASPQDAQSPDDDAARDTAQPPEDVTPLGRWQSYFNTPNAANGYEDQTLRDQLVRYLNGAVAGSQVRAHITQLSAADAIRPVVDALINAHDRGVQIWMVHDGAANHFPELATRLGARYVHCATPAVPNNSACLSNVPDGTHHMKNWYFSHTRVGGEDYRWMVIATSYNITVTQSRYFNDMLVVSGNQALYDAHVAVYEDYLHQQKTDDRHTQPHGKISVPTAASYTADFSPQKDGDMVADALRRITQYEEGCALGVGTLNMTRSTIYTQLERIKALGCTVRVVTGTPLSADKRARLDAAGIPHRLIQTTRNAREVSLHSKMMVYRGYYDTPIAQHPKNNRGWVWTGSQNFTLTPLRYRDDVFVGISRGGVTTNYWAYFEDMWASGE